MQSVFVESVHNMIFIEPRTSRNIFTDKAEFECFLSHESEIGLERIRYKVVLPYLIGIKGAGEYRVLNLMTCVFEPFTEENEGEAKFGFYLNSESYLLDSEEELNQFCTLVKHTCVFTGIESELMFIKKIGKGSTATVYLAQNITDKKEFAVKCIKKSNLLLGIYVQNLFREIQILRQLRHPNICKLHYVFEDEDKVYLVFENLSECSLLKLLTKRKTLTESQCQRFLHNLVRTIEYLHNNKIIHRDIKLENIMITNEETLDFKLIDFGLSYHRDESQLKKCGSPGYMAPEILRNELYDYKIDIFSVGVVLYVLLHGYLPFQGNSLKTIMNKNLRCEAKYNKNLSEPVIELLETMLCPLPELRPSALELLMDPWLSKTPLQISSTSNIQSCDFTS